MSSILCLLIILGILTNTNSDSTEEQQQFTYHQAYAPQTVDFRDIYHHVKLGHAAAEHEETSTTVEDFHLTVPTQFVEFHPQVLKIQPLNKNSTKKKDNDEDDNEGGVVVCVEPTTPSTTMEPDNVVIKVPKHYQRGVLDMLLPASRVRNFKSAFDTFRRILSYTFKRR